MRKEPSIFVSAQLRSCLLASPFGYHSDVCICCKPMTGAVQVAPSATFSKLLAIHSLWPIPPGSAAQGWAKLLCKAGFYQHWVQGCVSKCPPLPQVSPLPISDCWPAVNFILAADRTISGMASGGNSGLGFLDHQWQVTFKLQVKVVGLFPCLHTTSLILSSIFSCTC